MIGGQGAFLAFTNSQTLKRRVQIPLIDLFDREESNKKALSGPFLVSRTGDAG